MAFPDLIAQRAVMAGPTLEMRQEPYQNLPIYRPPFQQTSIPGAIVGALLAGSSTGSALMQNINAYRNRELGPAMEAEAARQFRSIGTPEAMSAADLLVQNPMIAEQTAQRYGGWPNWLAQLQSSAASQREASLIKRFFQSTPPDERSDEALAEFAVMNNISPERAFKVAALYGKLEDQESLTNIEKLQRALGDAQARGDTRAAAEIEDVIMRERFGSGMEIEMTPEGGFHYRSGIARGGEGTGLTTATHSNIEAKMSLAYDQMDRLRSIEQTAMPRFTTYKEQAIQKLLNIYEKGGGDLSPEQIADVEQYQEFRSNIMSDLVMTLQAISGAAVTEHEFNRIKEYRPNPSDSFTVLMSKLRAVKRANARMIARYNAIRNGASFTKESFPLYAIDKVVEDRHVKNVNTLLEKNPNMTPEEAVAASEQMIVKEFGVYYSDLVIKPPKRKD